MQTAPRSETADTRRGLAALSAGVAALLIWAPPGAGTSSAERLIKPAQAAHLSVVVLPFTNLSGDPSQDYFADGVTENLTTDLSRIRNSFVIALNTAFKSRKIRFHLILFPVRPSIRASNGPC